MRKHLVIGLVILSFLLLIGSVVVYLEQARAMRQLDPAELETMTKEQILSEVYSRQGKTHLPNYYFIPIFGFFGVAVGSLIYYLLGADLEKKDKAIAHNTGIILHLLSAPERKVVQKLLDNGGKAMQSEITYLDGFTKVKAHRVLNILIDKGIVAKEHLGKARVVTLHPDLMGVFKK